VEMLCKNFRLDAVEREDKQANRIIII